MTALESGLFGMVLFSALATLLQWRYRHAQNKARLNRGLREYMAAGAQGQHMESLTAVMERG